MTTFNLTITPENPDVIDGILFRDSSVCYSLYCDENESDKIINCERFENKTGFMSFAQGFLHDKNGNRPYRGRRTHSYKEAFYHVDHHNPFIAVPKTYKGSKIIHIFV